MKDRPLKHQVIMLFTIMSICIIIIMAYSFLSLYRLQYKIIEVNQEALTSQVLQEINNNYDYFIKLSTNLAYNESVQQFLLEDDVASQYGLFQSVSNLLINTQNMDTSIIDISVIGYNQNQANVSGDITVTSSLIDELPKDIKEIYFFGKQKCYIYANNLDCIMAACPVYPLDLRDEEPCGAIFIALSPAKFFGTAYVENNSNLMEMIFLDTDGRLILGNSEIYDIYSVQNKPSTLGSLKYNNIKYAAHTYIIPNIGYQMVTLIPSSTLTKQLVPLMAGQYLLTLLVFLVLSFALIYFINRFFHTTKELTAIMQKVNSGNLRALKERIDIDNSTASCLEAQQIVTSFNKMLSEIDTLNKNIFKSYSKMYEAEIYAKKTQLAYLRSQINPHFLYNTLTLICGMSTEGRSDDIINISRALSQILRYSFKGNEFVSLEEEFEIVQSYLMIQSTRFEGRFSIHFKISDEVRNAKIPKMILQPLVENAIVHGLEKKLDAGELQIGSHREPSNNTLVIWINDTGIGMPPERLEAIRRKLISFPHTLHGYPKEYSDEITENEHSIGLINVNTRIQLYFGEEYHLDIDSWQNIGTNIQIRIPFQLC